MAPTHQLAGGEPRLLEKVLGGPVAGQGHGIHAHASALVTPPHHVVHHQLAETDLARLLLHEDVVDHTEDGPVTQVLQADDAVADHHLVDGGHQHPGLGVVHQVGEAILDRFGPGLAGPPDGTAPHGGQLGDGGPGQVGEPGDVVRVGGPAALLH